MRDWEDYYQILGVDPAASAEEIRAAWRRKAFELHPDRLSQVSETARHSAEEELKRVNRAYEVLSNDEKRRRYHVDWLRRDSPPKPVVEPSVIIFSDAEPGESRTGSFVIRNDGGGYRSIWFSDPDSWVKVTGYASLEPDDELPLQVEITASGHDWGKHYIESIAVRLDGVEAAVRVQLHTKPAPARHHTRPAATPPRPAGFPAWASAIAWGAAALAIIIIIGIAVTSTPEQPSSPVMNQHWSQGATGSNYLGAPTPQPWSRPFGIQTNSPGIQPSPSGFPQGLPGFQQTLPGGPQTSPGFRQTSPGVQPRSPFRGISPGVQPRSPGFQPRSPVIQNNRSSGFQPTSPAIRRWP